MKRIAIVADSPLITSGFAQPAKMLTEAFVADGEFDVAVLGLLDSKISDTRAMGYWYVPTCAHDKEGYQVLISFLNATKPDVIMMIGDPGALSNKTKQFEMTGLRGVGRSMCYFPIEGLPIQPSYALAAQQFDFPVTYCNFGARELEEAYGVGVHVAPHGMDHGPFEQYPEDVRNTLRGKIGWQDKFIVGMVGVNKRSNRYPVLIDAMGKLLKMGYDDIYFYLHTSPTDTQGMAGWNLAWQIEHYGARDKYKKSHVLFTPEYIDGSPIYQGVDYRLPVAKLLEMDIVDEFDGSPESKRAAVFTRMGYITRLNLCDLYVDVASAHGWNLPAGEAMRCGLPVATVNDGFARTEIYIDTGAAYAMEPSPTPDYWHTGAQLKLVDVDVVVDTILKFYHDAELRKAQAEAGKAYADSLKWSVMTDMFIEAAKGLT